MVSKRDKIIVLSPAKTASISLEKYLLDSDVVFSDAINLPPHPTLHLTLSELCRMHNILPYELIDYKIIQIVRNPYARFVSAFEHQNRIIKTPITFEKLISKLLDYKYLLPNNMDEFYHSFYEMGWLQTSFQYGNWGGIRFWYEQSWYNDLNANVKYFKLEDLQTDISPLSNYLNLNSTEFPTENKFITKDWESYYTNETKSMVSKLYDKDLKLFNYGS